MSSQAWRSVDCGGVIAQACAVPTRVLAFSLSDQRYALPIDCVQEVQQIVALSEVSGSGTGLVGMIDLRGRVIPAVDLRRVLGHPHVPYTLQTPMVVCHTGSDLVALLVDSVEDVLDLPEGCFQTSPPMHPLALKMIGVARLADGLAYVLDAGLLLQPLSGGR